ncbi:MAG: hypothetical protein IJZ66_07520 [Oscillibacter sp.]|nr:hypothetical protein [Oscillibacter sp.]
MMDFILSLVLERFLDPRTYMLVMLVLGFAPITFHLAALWKINQRMEKTLKLADGPELLSALEELLQKKKEQRPQEMSQPEHHFLAERERTKDEDDPFARMENDRTLIAFVRANEREFR